MKRVFIYFIFISNSIFCQEIKLRKVIDYYLDSQVESLRHIDKSSSWSNVYFSDFTIPENIDSDRLIHEVIDYSQVVFQSCNNEIWDKERLYKFINRWGLDTTNCSKSRINSFINGIVGKYRGQDIYIIDSNNNFDLTDDKMVLFSDTLNQTHQIIFERSDNGEIIIDTVAIRVLNQLYDDSGNIVGLDFKYCEYRIGDFSDNGIQHKIKLYPNNYYTYHNSSKLIISDSLKIYNDQYVKINEKYVKLTISDKKGYSIFVEKMRGADIPFGSQLGLMAPDFEIRDSINLSDLKGKYIYLYFWNLDCRSCETTLPRYYQKYGFNEINNVEFILISVAKPNESQTFLQDNNIKWRNLYINGDDKLFKDYKIEKYPTGYLINKEGIVEQNQCNLRIEDFVQ